MKKLFFILSLLMLSFGAWAQTISISFTGKDAANHYVRLNRVIVTNLTQNWQETIYWPDTTLTLTNDVGIGDYENPTGFELSQNTPNPFKGTTDVMLSVVEAGTVTIDITDVNGRVVESQKIPSLQIGTHHFRVTLSTVGTYLMNARQNGKTSSIKMVNNGSGGENDIKLLEHGDGVIIVKTDDDTKGNVTHTWAYGDNLTIMGYATICGTECSHQFSRQLLYDETITIYFSESIITPTVAATNVSNMTSSSASVSSSASGDCGVTSRGFCYGTSSNPTINGQHTTNGSGTGNFTATLSGLTAGTTYYVRAYATNAAGTMYGAQTDFTPQAPPIVTTNSISSITVGSAMGGGNVTSQGTSSVTARGVCWSTSHNPTLADVHTTDGVGTGSFVSNITGLTISTTYYVRAYATNSAGTSYGNEVSFTTLYSNPDDGLPCPNAATVTDRDGNIYNTLQLGSQCWIKENLRTTHYADNTVIPASKNDEYSDIEPYRYAPGQDESLVITCGYLYNRPAVMYGDSSSSLNPSGVQGICPTGWHVPSLAEWTQLTDYVSSQSQYVCGGNSMNIAKALAANIGWNGSYGGDICHPAYMLSSNNATGFSMLPAGYSRVVTSNLFPYVDCPSLGSEAYFWSTTYHAYDALANPPAHQYKAIRCYGSQIGSYYNYGNRGYSVRCLRNDGDSLIGELPIVTTSVVSNITALTATCGGNVISDGGTTVITRGICWGTSHNPTIAGNHTSDGSGMGNFTSLISGLSDGITYVRAYATNSLGTSYGDEVIVTPNEGQPCPGISTVTDANGNVYNTVQIGSQCWMKENLRSTKYADNTPISQGTSSTILTNGAHWYYPANDSTVQSIYGLLYNWNAVMRNSPSSTSNPSGVQGICPIGWHVPSYAEWVQLTDYVSSQSQYVCDSNSTYIAKALASNTGWDNISYSGTCRVADTPSSNNATGLGLFPAGQLWVNSDGTYYNYYELGHHAVYWCSTEIGYPDFYGVINKALNMSLGYTSSVVSNSYNNKKSGYSVRCLRD